MTQNVPGTSVPLDDVEFDHAAAAAAIDAATRLVAVPFAVAATGARIVREPVIAAARNVDARVLVDVSLGAGAVPVNRETLRADLLVCRSEAWLLGPEGLAIVAGKGITPDDGARYHLPSVAGFARGCGWLSMYVGLPWVHARGQELTHLAAERLAAIEGVTVVTPPERATTLVFEIAGWTASDALEELGARIFLLASALESGALRIGIGAWTTAEEIETLAGGVALLASHDPTTMPSRRRLTILGTG